ncbi:MAG: ABC transporter substrate-binding protein [Burkholderiales bacterium]|nr:ABC transporter substrate-binding protein [Burkholderiales bacterium]
MKIKNCLAALVLFITATVFAADIAPDALVKNAAEEVLTIIKQDKDIQAGNTKKVVELVEAKVLPHFDFTRMTRLAMGRNWNQANDAQKQSLVKEFRTLLVRTYSVSLSQYRNQTIDYKPLKMAPDDKEATVKTAVVQPGGQAIPIDYRMSKTPEGWKVFDISVDGVSLVTNYRGSFNSTIEQSGVDGLIKSLAEKNKSAK